MSIIKEFKNFALKGNAFDLAIGVVIGNAFTGLVNSIVADLITPIIARFTGGIDFSNLFFQLTGQQQSTLSRARAAGATLAYGHFITLVINFLIVAIVLFFVMKLMRKFNSNLSPAKIVPNNEKLLAEIRDLLAKQKP